ncbi:MAG: hypothetical protein R2932_42205 [Caldilineaceae bacterium]
MRSIRNKTWQRWLAALIRTWRGLYKIGGILAIVYMVGSLIDADGDALHEVYDFNMDAATPLTFIAENRLWWIVWQGLICWKAASC